RRPPAVSASRSGARAALASRIDWSSTSGRLRPLALDEADDPLDRIEVLRRELRVLERDPELLLQEGHELEHAGRVDHAVLEERVGARERVAASTEEKPLDDEPANFRFDVDHVVGLP